MANNHLAWQSDLAQQSHRTHCGLALHLGDLHAFSLTMSDEMEKRMASRILPNRLKIVILQRLAAFDTPSQVADFVRQEFGVDITRQSIEYYDPAKNARLPQKWREVFERERTRFFSEQQRHPLDVRAYRQRVRLRLIKAHQANPALMRLLVNDCAKDVGGIFDIKPRGSRKTKT